MGFWECWTFRWCHLPVTLAVKGNSSGHWIHLFLYFIGIFIIANYFQKTIRKTAKIVRLNLDSVPKCYIIHFLNWHKVTIWYKIKVLWGFLCRWYAMAENALRWNLAVIEQNLFSEQTANEPLFLFVKPQLPSCGRTSHPQHTFSRTDTIAHSSTCHYTQWTRRSRMPSACL